jgi:hypothetical protein
MIIIIRIIDMSSYFIVFDIICKSPYNVRRKNKMVMFILWMILFVLCWPIAILALILFPIVWLISLPFRIVGIAVGGVLELLKAIIFLPSRILRDRQ